MTAVRLVSRSDLHKLFFNTVYVWVCLTLFITAYVQAQEETSLTLSVDDGYEEISTLPLEEGRSRKVNVSVNDLPPGVEQLTIIAEEISGDSDRLSAITPVTLSGGTLSVEITIEAVDDEEANVEEQTALVFSAEGHPGIAATLTVTVYGGICGRTQEIQNAIISAVSPNTCLEVTQAHLDGVTAFIVYSASDLRVGDFAGLNNMQQMSLFGGQVERVSGGVFAGLDNLRELALVELNGLDPVEFSEGAFAGLTNLQTLIALNNKIITLPAGMFDDLESLQDLVLQNNNLEYLPGEIYDDLLNLDILYLELTPIGDIPMLIAGRDEEITLEVSDKFIWGTEGRDRKADSYELSGFNSDVVIADINDNGIITLTGGAGIGITTVTVTAGLINNPYGSYDDGEATQEFIVSSDICGHTPAVRDAILATLDDTVTCRTAVAHLADIDELMIEGHADLTTLQTIDFLGLHGLTTLTISNTALEYLPTNIFQDLGLLAQLDLSDNQLRTLPADVFHPFSVTLTHLSLQDNPFDQGLPTGILDGLDQLVVFEMDLTPIEMPEQILYLDVVRQVSLASNFVWGDGQSGDLLTADVYQISSVSGETIVQAEIDGDSGLLTLLGLQLGTTQVTVTAQTDDDQSATQSFDVRVTSCGLDNNGEEVAAEDCAVLTRITFAGGSVVLSPTFDSGVIFYSSTVSHSVNQITMSAMANYTTATVMISPDDADTQIDRHQVNLSYGANTVVIRTAAPDGSKDRTYMLTINRELPPLQIVLSESALTLEEGDSTQIELSVRGTALDGGDVELTMSVPGAEDELIIRELGEESRLTDITLSSQNHYTATLEIVTNEGDDDLQGDREAVIEFADNEGLMATANLTVSVSEDDRAITVQFDIAEITLTEGEILTKTVELEGGVAAPGGVTVVLTVLEEGASDIGFFTAEGALATSIVLVVSEGVMEGNFIVGTVIDAAAEDEEIFHIEISYVEDAEGNDTVVQVGAQNLLTVTVPANDDDSTMGGGGEGTPPTSRRVDARSVLAGDDDSFGSAVAISDNGQTMVVGAPLATGSNLSGTAVARSGVARVYTRDESGDWSLQQTLLASNPSNDDDFGIAVSVSGDGSRIAVGARLEDANSEGVNPYIPINTYNNNGATNSGAVYIYHHDGTQWAGYAFIKAANTGARDWFGSAVALSADGNTLAVGARSEDGSNGGITSDSAALGNDGRTNSGATYVYEYDAAAGVEQWQWRVYIKPLAPSSSDRFGYSLDLNEDGSVLAAGAREDNGTGAAYVFARGGTQWSEASVQQAELRADNADDEDEFGFSVSLDGSGRVLLAGAPQEDSSATGVGGDGSNDDESEAGAAYVFAYDGTNWGQTGYLKGATAGDHQLGVSVSVSGDGLWLAAGAPLEDSQSTGIYSFDAVGFADGSGSGVGVVYVYRYDQINHKWTAHATIKPSEATEDLRFGTSAAWGGESTQTSLVIGGNGTVEIIPVDLLPRTIFVTEIDYVAATGQELKAVLSYQGDETVEVEIALGDGISVAPSRLIFMPGDLNKSIMVDPIQDGIHTSAIYQSSIRFSAAGYTEREIEFDVADPDPAPGINVSESLVQLLPGQSTAVEVSLSSLNGNSSVTVDVASDNPVIGVMPSALLFDNLDAKPITITNNSDGILPVSGSVALSVAPPVSYQSARVDVVLVGEFNRISGDAADDFGQAVAVSGDGQTMAVGASLSDGTDSSGSAANNLGIVYVYTKSELGAWILQSELSASNADGGDKFGSATAISDDGNTVAVGAIDEDGPGQGVNSVDRGNGANNSGAVYVYTRTGNVWSEQAYIKAFNAGANDRFGHSVALSGDGETLAVGVPREDGANNGIHNDGEFNNNNTANAAGAVYVYEFAVGEWQSRVYVKASDSEADDRFGQSVSLNRSGDRLSVGANEEDSNRSGIYYDDGDSNSEAPDSGAVYVFTRGSIWSSSESNQQAYIKASNTGAQDNFGYSVALSGDGDTLLAGALNERSNAAGVDGDQVDDSFTQAGAAYVFAYDGANWEQTGYLKAINSGNDQFGHSVSVSGDGLWLAVGALLEDSQNTGIHNFTEGDSFDIGDVSNAGAVYAYQYDSLNEQWFYMAAVKPFEASSGLNYGAAVAWGGESTQTSLAIGGDGAVEVIPIDLLPVTFFVSGSPVVEGSQQAVLPIAPSYQGEGNVQATLTAGAGLAIVGSSVLDFAPGGTAQSIMADVTDFDNVYAGGYTSYVIVSAEGYVEREAEIIILDDEAQPTISVSPDFVRLSPGQSAEITVGLSDLNGNVSVAAAVNFDSPHLNVTPTQLVFTESGGTITSLTMTITAPTEPIPYEHSMIALTADLYQSAEVNIAIGSLNLLEGDFSDGYGLSAAVSGDGQTMVVGAYLGDGTDRQGERVGGAGVAYVYAKNEFGGWLLQDELSASNVDQGDEFGYAVAISDDGNTIAAGARREDGAGEGVNPGKNNSDINTGAVYVYTRAGGTWSEQAYIKGVDTGGLDAFGHSVALSGDGRTLAVGAPDEDGGADGIYIASPFFVNNNADGAGAVYVYEFDGTQWQTRVYVKASDSEAGDQFGWSVSLNRSGDRLAVGAYSEDSNRIGIYYDDGDNNSEAPDSGAAYVFTRGTVWSSGESSQQAYIKASNTGEQDNFGYSVALSGDGDTLLAGTRDERSAAAGLNGDQTDNSLFSGGSGAGAAYLFRYADDEWTQTVYLKAINPGAQDQFGHSVSVSKDGQWLAVGALSEDSESVGVHSFSEGAGFDAVIRSNVGAVYVYQYDWLSERWLYMATVKPFEAVGGLNYGTVVAWGGESTQTSLVIGGRGRVEVVPISLFPRTFFVADTVVEGDSQAVLQIATSYQDEDNVQATLTPGDDLTIVDSSELDFMLGETSKGVMLSVTDFDDVYTGEHFSSLTVSAAGYVTRVAEIIILDDEAQEAINVSSDFVRLLPGQSAELTMSLSGLIDGQPVTVTVIPPDSPNINVIPTQLFFAEQGGAIPSLTVTITTTAGYILREHNSIDFVADLYQSAEVSILLEGSLNRLTGSAGDDFGRAAAISRDGQTMVIGASAGDGINASGNPVNNSGIAYVYVRNEFGEWLLQEELSANNLGNGDEFGYSVAISDNGNTAVVGARYEDGQGEGVNPSGQGDNESDAGAVYVYTRAGEAWSQQAYIKAFNADTGDEFGRSVALSGDGVTLAVGSPLEDGAHNGIHNIDALTPGSLGDNNRSDSGAVFIYQFDGTQWQSRVYVKALDSRGGDQFGWSVSLNQAGNLLAAGAHRENSNRVGVHYDNGDGNTQAQNSGVVYLFENRGNDWTAASASQQAYIKASNTGDEDNFGHSVALSGDGETLLVGALNERSSATGVNGDQADDSLTQAGAAYVFEYDATDEEWTQTGYLKAINTGEDQFGQSVSVSQDGLWLAAGAPLEDSQNTGIHNFTEGDSFDIGDVSNAGAVYVYQYDPLNAEWFYMTTIKPLAVSAGLNYGVAVAWAGESTRTGLVIGGDGAVEVIPIDTLPRTFFVERRDEAVSEGSEVVLQIAPSYLPAQADVTISESSGLLTIESNTLTFSTAEPKPVTLTAIDVDDEYSRDRNTVLTLSAPGYVDKNYELTITDDDAQANSVEVDQSALSLQPGGTATVNVGLDGFNAGVFEVTVTAMVPPGAGIVVNPKQLTFRNTQAQPVEISYPDAGYTPHQQYTIEFVADDVVAYASTGLEVFIEGDLGRLTESADNDFGAAVAVSGDGQTMVVGAPSGDGTNRSGDVVDDSGIAYVYVKNESGGWLLQDELSASNANEDDEFGYAVAISDDGNTIAVGARGEDGIGTGVNPANQGNADTTRETGATYVYTRAGGEWIQQAYIKAFLIHVTARESDQFGHSVALSGDGETLAVGAPQEDGGNAGIYNHDDLPAGPVKFTAGAVYVYEFNGTDWQPRIYVKAPDSEAGDQFGWSLSLNQPGDLLAVGAHMEDSNRIGVHYDRGDANAEANNSGAVYVLARGTGWRRGESSWQAYIKASNTGNQDNFGHSVALSEDGETLLAGARDERSNAAGVDGDQADDSLPQAGAAYVFEYDATDEEWTQTGYLKAINPGIDRFGQSVSVSDDGLWLAAGAPLEDSQSTGIHNFTEGDSFDIGDVSNAGAVYVYQYDPLNEQWFYMTTIKPFAASESLHYGVAVAWGGEGEQTSLAIGGDGEVEVIPFKSLPGTFFVSGSPVTEGDVQAVLRIAPSYQGADNVQATLTAGDGLTVMGPPVLDFAPGATSESITVNVADFDSTYQAEYLSHLTVSAQGYVTRDAEIIILDNDTQQTISVLPDFVQLLPGQSAELTVSISGLNGNDSVEVTAEFDSSYINVVPNQLNFVEEGGAIPSLEVTLAAETGFIPYERSVVAFAADLYQSAEAEFVVGGEFNRLSGSGDDDFGSAVAVSGDGQTMVVGASAGDGTDSDGMTINDSGVAYVYIRTGFGEWFLQDELSASNADRDDEFGYAAAISDNGNTIVVSARAEDSPATGVNPSDRDNGSDNTGAVYVYARTGNTWSEQAYIKAFNAGANDEFGTGVALSGDGLTLAVGVPSEDGGDDGIYNEGDSVADDAAENAGAVYVYAFSSTQWQSQVYVKASDSRAGDQFGWSVSLNQEGNRLAVGAYMEDSNRLGVYYDAGDANVGTPDSGAVYVFTRGTAWNSSESSQQAYIKASNTGEQDHFGYSVALSGDGDTLLVGARDERSNATGADGDQSNNELFDEALGIGAGAAYTFRYADSEWTQTGYLKAINTGSDRFSRSVSVSKDGLWLAVGALLEDSTSTGIHHFSAGDSFDVGDMSDTGAVYLYQYDSVNQEWFYMTTIKPYENVDGLRYGRTVFWGGESTRTSLAIGGDGVVEVIPFELLPRTFFVSESPVTEGATAVLQMAPSYQGEDNVRATLTPGDGLAVVGSAVLDFAPGATSESIMVNVADFDNAYIGEYLSHLTVSAEGYVTRNAEIIILDNDAQQTISVSRDFIQLSPGQSAELEVSVSDLNGNTSLTVTAEFDNPHINVTPTRLAFAEEEGVIPSVAVTLTAEAGFIPHQQSVVAFTADLYQSAEVEFVIEGRFSRLTESAADNFGLVVAVSGDGDTMAVSAPVGDGTNGIGNTVEDSGITYVYARSESGEWLLRDELSASNAGADDEFGYTVAVSDNGDVIAVGARKEDSATTGVSSSSDEGDEAEDSGAVYIYTRDGTGWSEQAYIKAFNTGMNDEFGTSVALSGDGLTLAVGAPLEDGGDDGIYNDGELPDVNNAEDAGAVYVYGFNGSQWRPRVYIKASDSRRDDQFGWSVDLDQTGNRLAASAHTEGSNRVGVHYDDGDANEDSPNSGAVYVFTRGTTWNSSVSSQQAYIKASNTGERDYFGHNLSLSGDGETLVVGARDERSNATGVDGDQSNNALFAEILGTGAGAAYAFRHVGGEWMQTGYLKAINTGSDRFGRWVSVSKDGVWLAAGAFLEDSASTGIHNFTEGDSFDVENISDAGAVYVYQYDSVNQEWFYMATIKPHQTANRLRYGRTVSWGGESTRTSLAIGGDGVVEVISVDLMPRTFFVEKAPDLIVEDDSFELSVVPSIAVDEPPEVSVTTMGLATADLEFTDVNLWTLSVDIENDGLILGDSLASVALDAMGYEPRSLSLTVNDIGNQFVVQPSSLTLTEGQEGELEVSLLAITDGVSVTVTTTEDLILNDVGTIATFTFSDTGGQRLKVTARDDSLHVGDRLAVITFSAERYDTQEVLVMIEEDDDYFVVSDPADRSLTLTEGGAPDQITFAPIALPTGAPLTVSVEAQGDIKVDTQQIVDLTFNTLAMQTINVTADDDDDFDAGEREATVIITAEGYDSTVVTVTIEDGDNYFVVSDPADQHLVMTEGMPGQITFAPFAIPTDGQLTVSVEAQGGIRVDAAQSVDLTFNTVTMQTISVTVEDDNVNVGDRSATVVITADGYDDTVVTVTVEDDDDYFVVSNPVDRHLVIAEGSALKQITFAPIALPADGQLTVGVEAQGDIRVDATQSVDLTFNTTAMQTISVTIEDDDVNAGDRPATVIITADGYDSAAVTVVIEDNDDYFVVSDPVNRSLTLSEGGAPGQITFAPIALPADGQLTVSVEAQDGVKVDAAQSANLIFGTTEAQTIEVIADDDALNIGERQATVVISADGYDSTVVAVTIEEDDDFFVVIGSGGAGGQCGSECVVIDENNDFFAVSSTALVLVEGNTGTYEIAPFGLTGEATVTVSVMGDISVNGGAQETELGFDEQTTQRTIMITATDDVLNTGDRSATVVITADGYNSATLRVTIEEDDDYFVVSPTEDLEFFEGGSAMLQVSPFALFRGELTTVTVSADGNLTLNGSDSVILTFSDPILPQAITIETEDDNSFTGRRSGMITIAAEHYRTTQVQVFIIDDEQGFDVSESTLVLAEGGSETITMRPNGVIPTGGLNVRIEATTDLTVTPNFFTIVGGMVGIQITAINDNVYNDVPSKVTISATNYQDSVIDVTVTDNDVLAIRLLGELADLSELSLVYNEESTVSMVVDNADTAAPVGTPEVTVTAQSSPTGILTFTDGDSVSGRAGDELTLEIQAGDLQTDQAMLILTATADDYKGATLAIPVTVGSAALIFKIKVFLEGAQ